MSSVCEFISSCCCCSCPALNRRVAPLSSPPPPHPSEPVPPVDAQPDVPAVPPQNPPPPPPPPAPQNANHRTMHVRPQIRGQRRVINGIHPDPPTVWQGAA